MVMSERSTVVGVFTEDLYAELAVDELRRVGFSDDEINVSKPGAATGGFMASLKSLFSGQETTSVATKDDFMRLGVSEQDADYYQDELDAGRTIVLVRVAGQQQEVSEILRNKGAKTSRPPNPNTQAETDQSGSAPYRYDSHADYEPGDDMMSPETPREP
jgi:hypothetical protein